jgi:N-acetylglucosaminyl-diphospho-decaprenol L-rhamnosyltransferase
MTRVPPLTLAIIIVSWNVREHLDRCLTSLSRTLDADAVRALVWVGDNRSSDGSAELVAESYPWVHLTRHPENIGYVRANNTALEALADRARYYWLLNPDTIVPTGSVRAMVDFMDGHPNAGLAGPKLLNADGTRQECAFRFPGLTQALYSLELMPRRLYYSALNGRYPHEKFEQTAPFRIDHPLGAAMMARQEAIAEVGYLDEAFFMYCEEIDWAWRMNEAGWQTFLVPTAEVIHLGGASSQQARPQTTAYLWESRAHLYRKHAPLLTRHIVRLAVRSVFRRRLRLAESAAWVTAYQRILTAWTE